MTTSNEVLHAHARPASTTRRTLLRAAPALLAPGLLPAAAIAGGVTGENAAPDTPLLVLFRQWDDLMARWNGAPDEDSDALAAEAYALEQRIAAELVTSLTDLAAKVVALSCYGDQALHDSVARECEAILAGRLA